MWLQIGDRAPRGGPNQHAVSTSPLFQVAVEKSGAVFDDAQRVAISRLLDPPTHGFYIWGGVGRGKSMLADLYYETVPTTRKRRFHFHDFFRELQTEIAENRQPLEASITRIIGSARVVLFDEFHVHDVADAVYLTKALDVLIQQGILMLATSNYAPDQLLPNPLFHDRFVPAITLIKSRLVGVAIADGLDYRGTLTGHDRAGFGAGCWIIDPDVATVTPRSPVELEANGLVVRAVTADRHTATFTFAELCDRPLGTREYLSLADDFDSIRIVAVPDLASVGCNPLMRLCNLIDVLHDRDQQLDVQAVAAPDRMREANQPPPDVSRALSRLSTLSTSTCTEVC